MAKTLTVRLSDELHKKAKLQALTEGKTLQDYVIEILVADLENKQPASTWLVYKSDSNLPSVVSTQEQAQTIAENYTEAGLEVTQVVHINLVTNKLENYGFKYHFDDKCHYLERVGDTDEER